MEITLQEINEFLLDKVTKEHDGDIKFKIVFFGLYISFEFECLDTGLGSSYALAYNQFGADFILDQLDKALERLIGLRDHLREQGKVVR